MSFNGYWEERCRNNAAALDRAQRAWENPPEDTDTRCDHCTNGEPEYLQDGVFYCEDCAFETLDSNLVKEWIDHDTDLQAAFYVEYLFGVELLEGSTVLTELCKKQYNEATDTDKLMNFAKENISDILDYHFEKVGY